MQNLLPVQINISHKQPWHEKRRTSCGFCPCSCPALRLILLPSAQLLKNSHSAYGKGTGAVVSGVSIGAPSPGMELGHFQAATIALLCPVKPLAAQPDLAGCAWCAWEQLCRVSGAHLGKHPVPGGAGGSCHPPSRLRVSLPMSAVLGNTSSG